MNANVATFPTVVKEMTISDFEPFDIANILSPAPDMNMITSIRMSGLLMPVAIGVVERDGNQAWEVIWGRRRLKALKYIQEYFDEEKPFRVIEYQSTLTSNEAALLSQIENFHRSDNVIGSALAVSEVLEYNKMKGMSLPDAVKETASYFNVTIGTIKSYLRYNFPVWSIEAYKKDEISQQVLETIAKKPEKEKKEIEVAYKTQKAKAELDGKTNFRFAMSAVKSVTAAVQKGATINIASQVKTVSLPGISRNSFTRKEMESLYKLLTNGEVDKTLQIMERLLE